MSRRLSLYSRARAGTPNRQPRTKNRTAAFTLVEVILAIAIAIGLLVVALHFYGQAADLRSRLLEESDRLSSIRLYLDRLTMDLRAAFAQPQVGFTGDSSFLRFVVAAAPQPHHWNPRSRSRPDAAIATDLTIVRYGVTSALEGTNSTVTGLTRSEHPLLELPSVTRAVTNRASSLPLRSGSATNEVTEVVDPGIPVLDAVRFVMFSFWDGSGWSDRWDAPGLPSCVEVTLGAEPLPEGLDPLDYPYESFRRVIYLPGSRAALAAVDPVAEFFE